MAVYFVAFCVKNIIDYEAGTNKTYNSIILLSLMGFIEIVFLLGYYYYPMSHDWMGAINFTLNNIVLFFSMGQGILYKK